MQPAVAFAQARLGDFFRTVNAFTVAIDPAVTEKVFQAYFAQQPPFSARKKEEFPDAFVIASLSRWCVAQRAKLCVLTADSDMIATCTGDPLIALAGIDAFSEVVLAHDDRRMAFVTELVSNHLEVLKKHIAKAFSAAPLSVPYRDISIDYVHTTAKDITVTDDHVVDVDDGSARLVLRAKISFGADITERIPHPSTDPTNGVWHAPLVEEANIIDDVTVNAEVTFSYESNPPCISEVTDVWLNDGQPIELDGSFREFERRQVSPPPSV